MCGLVCKFNKSCTFVILTLELALKVSDMTFRRDCKKSEHAVTCVMELRIFMSVRNPNEASKAKGQSNNHTCWKARGQS